MARAVRFSVAAALMLALAGCFISSQALIPPEKAEYPLPAKAGYEHFRSKDGGKTWDKEQDGTLERAGPGYMLDGETDSAFMMRAAFDTFYIAQLASSDGFEYDLLRLEGNRIYVYNLTCGDDDQRYVKSGLLAEITADGDGLQCRADSFGNLSQVFRDRYVAGAQPKSLYVIK